MKFKKGDWVADDSPYTPRIAIVRDAYDYDGEELLDLVIYDGTGLRLGRTSPAMGGPRDFEPACSATMWYRIARPHFPLPRFEYDHLIVWIDARPRDLDLAKTAR